MKGRKEKRLLEKMVIMRMRSIRKRRLMKPFLIYKAGLIHLKN